MNSSPLQPADAATTGKLLQRTGGLVELVNGCVRKGMVFSQVGINGFKIVRGGRPTGCASRLKHAFNAGVHVLLLNPLAASNLLNTGLDVLLEPLVASKKLGNSLLHEIVSATPGLGGKLVEFNFLISE